MEPVEGLLVDVVGTAVSEGVGFDGTGAGVGLVGWSGFEGASGGRTITMGGDPPAEVPPLPPPPLGDAPVPEDTGGSEAPDEERER